MNYIEKRSKIIKWKTGYKALERNDIMDKIIFGKTINEEEACKYEIANKNGMKVVLTDFGAAVVELWVKDKNGNLRDVALGYGDVRSYEKETTYFGAIVGRYANRIMNAKIEIDGVTYELDANDNENSLHSGKHSMAKKVWTVKEQKANKIIFTYTSKDLEQGFPGTVVCDVTYELTEADELVISYHAVSDKKTTFNMTNHTYFNLNGHDAGDVLKHELMIKASAYTPVKNSKAIPTGEIATVEGTPFDFRVPKTIGRDISQDFEQLIYGGGYDHNFAIDKETDGVEKIATAYSPESGIQMDVWTDCIGVQLYTGNFLNGDAGKGGCSYGKRGGFCLETQYFPNSINEPNFVRPITEANVPYETKTIFAFGVR